jgi:hypothetical protein
MVCLSTLTRGSLSLRLCLAVTLIAYAVLSETNASQAASPPTRVAIAYPNPTPRVAPLWIAQELENHTGRIHRHTGESPAGGYSLLLTWVTLQAFAPLRWRRVTLQGSRWKER